jgi:hypothetical protein
MPEKHQKTPKTKPDDKEQSRLFVEAARKRGATKGALPADELMGKLAKMPPEPRGKKSE